jgi:hypothetical protein
MACHCHHSVVLIRAVQKLEGLQAFCGSVFWCFCVAVTPVEHGEKEIRKCNDTVL